MPVLSILKVNGIKELREGDKIVSPKQTGLQESIKNDVSIPKTSIEVLNITDKTIKLKIRQESETRNKPIRILWEKAEEIQDYDKGWQEIYFFEGIYNKETSELVLFCDEENTKLFLDRVEQRDIDAAPVKFDLVKARDMNDFRIWGIWGKGDTVHIAKKAIFGYNLEEENEIKPENITALNITFHVGGQDINMTISKEGRISSNNRMLNKDLYEFYQGLRSSFY